MARKHQFSAKERARIRELGPAPSLSKTEEEWEEIIFQRLEGILNGTTKSIPMDEAVRQVLEELQHRRGGR